jgi:ABC-2 type transport system permease protein
LLKGFSNVLVKELKELIRDPKILLGMIIVPLIMFPILGGVMSFSMQTAQEQAQKASIVVINHDGGNYAQFLTSNLSIIARVFISNYTLPKDAVDNGELTRCNTTQLIEIPDGFSANMTEHIENGNPNATAFIKLYSVFSGAGLFEGISSSLIDLFMQNFNRQFAPNVVYAEKSSIIKGEIHDGVDPQELSTLMISQAIALPITIMILLTFSMQIAATSVAMEKEEKTLETLLTLPVDRFAILMGKLSGSIVIAGVGALTYMVGFNYYLSSFTSITAGTNVDLVSLGLTPSPLGYLILGVSLFVTLLSALALAVILSAFAEDVRGAQSLVGYIYPFLIVPAMVLMYVDVNSLPLAIKIVLYAIPFSHPTIASKAVVMGDYWTAVLGIAYVSMFTIGIMYVASRLFATEKILTTKLRFRGLRRRRKAESDELP